MSDSLFGAIGASTYCLLSWGWQEATAKLLEQGFTAVELFGDAPQAHFTQLDAAARRRLRTIGARCELSVHAPAYELNVGSANPCNRDEAVRQYREALYLAAEIGARRLVVHEGHVSYWKLDRGVARSDAMAGLSELVGIARQVGVALGLENTNYGKFAMYDTWQEWVAMADRLAGGNDGPVSLVLDVGHAHLAGWDLEKLSRAVGGRLAQIHVHDNLGSADDHLMPGQGVLDWAGLRRGLAQAGSKATLILESGPFLSADDTMVGKTWLEDWAKR
jgi:sugar phosphate isomerase/epimerase